MITLSSLRKSCVWKSVKLQISKDNLHALELIQLLALSKIKMMNFCLSYTEVETIQFSQW